MGNSSSTVATSSSSTVTRRRSQPRVQATRPNVPNDVVLEIVRALASVWKPIPRRDLEHRTWYMEEWAMYNSNPSYDGDFTETSVIPEPPEWMELGGSLGWITVTHVSQHLRRLVQANVPECWASVIGRVPKADIEIMPRTGDRPLDVLIHSAFAREFSDVVRRNINTGVIPRNRIRTLTIIENVVCSNPFTSTPSESIDMMTNLQSLNILASMATQGQMSEEFPLLRFTHAIPRVRCVNYVAHFTGVTHLYIGQTTLGYYAEEQWRVEEDELIDVLAELSDTLQDLTLSIAFRAPVENAVDVDRTPLLGVRNLQLQDLRAHGFGLDGVVHLLRRLRFSSTIMVTVRISCLRTPPVLAEHIRAFYDAGVPRARACSIATTEVLPLLPVVLLKDYRLVNITFYSENFRLFLTMILDCPDLITPVDASDSLLDALPALDMQSIGLTTNIALPSHFERDRHGITPRYQQLGPFSVLTYWREILA
ncbi:unnamed protein product [Peniophora sp. CBMAI 1063]|nr:unnamed protein product [Peniophora sp. CBMAI 1063]